MIIRAKPPGKLQDVIRDLKSYTARHIRKLLEDDSKESRSKWMLEMMKRAGRHQSNTKDFQCWAHHNHPVELDSNAMIEQRLNYIHQNPVKAGFVDNPYEWVYSSARDYSGEKGLLEITFLD
jgi:REP element-mobilizing transposase RayT